jgi:hypothetical protein
VEVAQQTVGIFKREPVPVYELVLQDFKGKPLVFALFVAGNLPRSEKNDFVYLFKNFLCDSKKMTTITGMFVCFAIASFPEDVLEFLKKHSESDHPVGRYEALISGYGGPVNLVGCQITTAQIPTANNGTDEEPSGGDVDGETDAASSNDDAKNAVKLELPSDKFEFELIYPDLTRKNAELKL